MKIYHIFAFGGLKSQKHNFMIFRQIWVQIMLCYQEISRMVGKSDPKNATTLLIANSTFVFANIPYFYLLGLKLQKKNNF